MLLQIALWLMIVWGVLKITSSVFVVGMLAMIAEKVTDAGAKKGCKSTATAFLEGCLMVFVGIAGVIQLS